MKIFFVTHNKDKVKEAKAILEPSIEVEQVNFDYLELRSDDPQEVSKLAAKQCAERFGKAVVVEDSGLFINAWDGFPGTCSAYIHKRIGLKGILKLMEGVKDRSCSYRSAVGYCKPGKEAVVFLGEEEGKVADMIRGSYGFGHDPIFIPENSDKTYGEMRNAADAKKFRRIAFEKLRDHVEKSL